MTGVQTCALPIYLSEDHLNRALYICRYLLGTADYALIYNGKGDGGLIVYANSDWASDPVTRKSTTGYLVKLADCYDMSTDTR